MKVNIIVNVDNVITDVITKPLKNSFPTIEISSLSDIHVGHDKFIDGKVVKVIDDETSRKNIDIIKQINENKHYLSSTDYKLFKYLEGSLSEKEYLPIKDKRQKARDTINKLERELLQNNN